MGVVRSLRSVFCNLYVPISRCYSVAFIICHPINVTSQVKVSSGLTEESVSLLPWCNWLTPWNRIYPEKLTRRPLGQFLTFCGNRRFTAAFTSTRHLHLSWARAIQSMPPHPTSWRANLILSFHPTSWRANLILSFHLYLGLASGLFPSGFCTKILYATVLSHYLLHVQLI